MNKRKIGYLIFYGKITRVETLRNPNFRQLFNEGFWRAKPSSVERTALPSKNGDWEKAIQRAPTLQ
jgi:hypothetical protein